MEYKVKIDEFEGPLDLLLHLIKEANIDIYDIKISDITDQYLAYINAMESLNLSIASEYLVMAAELLEMKSRVLLPSNKEVMEDGFEEDLETSLIKRLVDYKQYKEMTSTFKELEFARGQIYTKLPSNMGEYKEKEIFKEDHSISLLLDAFAKFLERSESQKPLHTKVTSKELSLDERICKIRNILHTNEKMALEQLLDETSREYIIVTFLAVLQMSKDQEIDIEQSNNFESIYIKLKGRV
ncbi:MAG: segregation/condensation protein A [Bacilli bacterium]|jgi:segregation and condensation protein A